MNSFLDWWTGARATQAESDRLDAANAAFNAQRVAEGDFTAKEAAARNHRFNQWAAPDGTVIAAPSLDVLGQIEDEFDAEIDRRVGIYSDLGETVVGTFLRAVPWWAWAGLAGYILWKLGGLTWLRRKLQIA